MKIETALAGVSRLFLDTAPVIYFVERNPLFVDRVDPIFERFESEITPVVGSVTVAECLVGALQMSLTDLEQAYVAIFKSDDVLFVENTLTISQDAARIRVQYNLRLPDALQIAAAMDAGCQAFLTNDAQLKRIAELNILLVSELEV
ncbi:MAG: type II toxin-antitoxin system VapC family toxin [Phormidium sp. SL48-SHIP]|nr:MAG: type II toxin-antitoxin system VapC family toxin [Phormidium sp. SL48-SHIP]